MTTRRMRGLYPRNLQSHRTHLARQAAADPDFWGGPGPSAEEMAAAAADRAARCARFDAWVAATKNPDIRFPMGEATDYKNGQLLRYVEVDGVGEWFALGSDRSRELQALYLARQAATREIFGR